MIQQTVRRRTVTAALLLAALLTGCANSSPPRDPELASERRVRVAAFDSDELNFIAFADWGQNNPAQRRVSAAIKQYVGDFVRLTRRSFDGALLGGDNFYVDLHGGADDPSFRILFEDMYDRDVLDFPFYAAPGNHDYEDNKLNAQIEYTRRRPESRWKMPWNYYRVDVHDGREQSGEPLLSVFMLDSNRDHMGTRAWQAQLTWLDVQLAESSAPWKVAVAHHPLFSNGDHGDVGVLQRTWGPMFDKHGVDLYVCGHDHDLQHLQIPGWPTSFIGIGGGGAHTRPIRVDRRGPFAKSSYGFGHLSVTRDALTVRLINDSARVVHEFRRSRDGEVTVLQTSPSDVAMPRTRRSITRPDLNEVTRPTATRPATNPTTAPSPTGTGTPD
jgi:hypothetical protein